jgi:DNA invertase Pin-like site-specific DNA recombinase
MTRVGYARVSTSDQHPEAQHDALTAAGCTKIFTDAGVSGRLASRPQWDACLAYLRPGDVLVVTKLDRLGRSLKNLLEVAATLDARGIDLHVIDQSIDTTSPVGRLFFALVGAFAEFERDMIAERTRDGIAAARARGRHGGRPAKLTAQQADAARTLYAAGGQTVTEIAAALGVGRSTMYRALAGANGKEAAR